MGRVHIDQCFGFPNSILVNVCETRGCTQQSARYRWQGRQRVRAWQSCSGMLKAMGLAPCRIQFSSPVTSRRHLLRFTREHNHVAHAFMLFWYSFCQGAPEKHIHLCCAMSAETRHAVNISDFHRLLRPSGQAPLKLEDAILSGVDSSVSSLDFLGSAGQGPGSTSQVSWRMLTTTTEYYVTMTMMVT